MNQAERKKKQVRNDVVIGSDGYLFLTGGPHAVEEHLRGNARPAESSVATFSENIAQRSAAAREIGAEYIHVIFPEKGSALRDLMPFEVLCTYSDSYRKEFTPDILEIDLTGRQDAFRKADTHLSFFGRVESCTQMLSRLLNLEPQRARMLLESRRGEIERRDGDLGRKLESWPSDNDYHVVVDPIKMFTNRIAANDGLTILCVNPDLVARGVSRRMLIFGDSFMEFSLPLMSLYFSEIIFCRTRFFHSEMVEMHRPDYVLTENAERYLATVRADSDAPRFFNYYGLNNLQAPIDESFYRAYDAMLSPGSRKHAEFLSKIVDNHSRPAG